MGIQLHIVELSKPHKKAEDFLLDEMLSYNANYVPERDSDRKTLLLILRDEQHNWYGGLMADFAWEAMKIYVLWIKASFRGKGYGKQLLQEAEKIALEENCRLIYLETTSFHHHAFYVENGFVEAGKIDNYPKGHTFYLMKKDLDKSLF